MAEKHVNQLAEYISELNEDELNSLADRLVTAHAATAERQNDVLNCALFDEYLQDDPSTYLSEDPEYA